MEKTIKDQSYQELAYLFNISPMSRLTEHLEYPLRLWIEVQWRMTLLGIISEASLANYTNLAEAKQWMRAQIKNDLRFEDLNFDLSMLKEDE